MFDKAMKIFDSEFEFNAFMLQIAHDYEKKYFLKKENYFYFIKSEEQLLEAATAYKNYLDNSNEKEYNAKIKKIFAGAPVRQFKNEDEEKNAPEKKYNRLEITVMTVLALCALVYAIFLSDTITERVVVAMSGIFLLISPISAIRGRISKIIKERQNK